MRADSPTATQPPRDSLRLEYFEYVMVGGSRALVRLSGRWESGAGSDPGAVALVMSTPEGEQLVDPLPTPPAGAGGEARWNAAWPVASATVAGARGFALQVADGRAYDLPHPHFRNPRHKSVPAAQRLTIPTPSAPAQAGAGARREERPRAVEMWPDAAVEVAFPHAPPSYDAHRAPRLSAVGLRGRGHPGRRATRSAAPDLALSRRETLAYYLGWAIGLATGIGVIALSLAR